MGDQCLGHYHGLGPTKAPHGGGGGQVSPTQPARDADVGNVVAVVHMEQSSVHHLQGTEG